MITIYGKTGCTYCAQARAILDVRNIPYRYKKLNEDFTREEILSLNPNAKTFPQIFDGDRLIGGYTELRNFLETIDGSKAY